MLNTQDLQQLYQRYRIFTEGFVEELAVARQSADEDETVEWTTLKVIWPTLQKEVQKNSRSMRSEEHTSELQSLMRISYAVFCLKKKNNTLKQHHHCASSIQCNKPYEHNVDI